MKRSYRRLLRAAAFMLVLVMFLTCVPQFASAVTQEEIDDLKKELSSLTEEKQGYSQQLALIKDDMSAAIERKTLLDQEISATEEMVAAIEEIVALYETEIGTLEEDIAAAQAELEEAQALCDSTYELYCERVRALEEGGSTTYWGIIFGATSFSDMLTRIDFVNEVIAYNEEIIQNYNDMRVEIEAGEASLRDQLAEKQDIVLANEAAKAELLAHTEELEGLRTEASELILEIKNNQEQYQDIVDAYEADEAAVEKEIKKKEAELAEERRKEEERRRAAEAARNKSTGSSGTASSGGVTSGAYTGYIWPVSSRRITSGFGYRSAESTNGVGSINHGGLDIGGVYYSTPVVASKAGRVTIATYSSSYGNYVVIDHGDGSTTLYAHMSSLKVSAGQNVSRGQQIGVTGATGNVTGPHLHFEIRINGTKVDPAKYLP